MHFTGEQNIKWTKIIRPGTKWSDIEFMELWEYRDLIFLLVQRDFVAYYKQTVLGPIWFFLQPLFTTFVFTVIFGTIAQVSTDGLPAPLFFLSGTVVWNYFASCLTNTSSTFVSNTSVFGKVYFPRLVVPISIVITNLLTFGLQLVLLLILMGIFALKGFPVAFNGWLLLTPLLLLQMAALGMGVGILIASLTTKYRDLTFVLGFGVQLWMYATPIVYPLSQVPSSWQWVFLLNPMVSIVETFRFAFLGVGQLRPDFIFMSILITIIVLLIGLIMFHKIEKTFMDTI